MTVSLYSGSKTKNIRKSVNEFVHGKLSGQEGLNLDWGQTGFKEEGLERWIQFRIYFSTGVFMRQVDNENRKGEVRDIFLNFNIFEEHPPRRNIYWIESIRKQIFEYIYLKKIAILDFDLSGNPAVGELPVMEILNDSEIDDGRSTGLRQWNMNMLGEFLFKYV